MSAPKILGTGRCVPPRVVSNEEICRNVDSTDEWVYSRTGIRNRRFCVQEQSIDLAEGAARKALDRAGISPEEVGVCLVATLSPDFATPSTACRLQQRLGMLEDTVCFDLNSACAGFLYGLKTAHALLEDARRPYALVIGVEVLSRLLDMTDRDTCFLFGDGAGAAVICRDEESRWDTVFGARGDEEAIWVQGPGPERSLIHMDGKVVYRFAIEVVEKTIHQLLDSAGLRMEDIDVVICHQANARIIDVVARKMGASEGLFYKDMDRYGNTSAASVPIAMDELAESGKLQRGMNVLFVGFGSGLTWAGALLTW